MAVAQVACAFGAIRSRGVARPALLPSVVSAKVCSVDEARKAVPRDSPASDETAGRGTNIANSKTVQLLSCTAFCFKSGISSPPPVPKYSPVSPSRSRLVAALALHRSVVGRGRAACSSVVEPSGKADEPSGKADEEAFARLRRYEEFKEMLQEPDDIFIPDRKARKMFQLTRADMEELGENFILKESPYDAQWTQMRQYPLSDLVQLAKRKYSEEELIKHYSRRYLFASNGDKSKIYGDHHGEDASIDSKSVKKLSGKKYWYNAPSTTTLEGRASVVQGLKMNLGICTAKGGVWLATGSHVMFADLMHSVADVLNYSYRLLELNRSSRDRDVDYPYGYSPLRYITADRSFVFLGFVGGVCPLIAGASEMMHAHAGMLPMGDHLMAVSAVFVISASLEAVAVRTAYHEILSLHAKEFAHGRDTPKPSRYGIREVIQYIREGRDVMSTATFTEASSGVLASFTGLAGIGASVYFQNGAHDVAASMLMASMVCGVSTFLLRKSGNALLGQTLPRWRVRKLVERLEVHEAIVNVYDVKTEVIGTDTVRFKAEVQFNPQAITERILSAMRAEDESGGRGVLAARLRQSVQSLQRGVPAEKDADVWLYRNNNLFYEALAGELKDVEKVIRGEFRDFRNVHVDLEPW